MDNKTMLGYKAFEIAADAFGAPRDVDFYQFMGVMKFDYPEIYDLILKALTKDVVSEIKAKLNQ